MKRFKKLTMWIMVFLTMSAMCGVALAVDTIATDSDGTKTVMPDGTVNFRFVDENGEEFSGDIGTFDLYDANGKKVATLKGTGDNITVSGLNQALTNLNEGKMRVSVGEVSNAFNLNTYMSGYEEFRDHSYRTSIVYNKKVPRTAESNDTIMILCNETYRVTTLGIRADSKDVITIPKGTARATRDPEWTDSTIKSSRSGYAIRTEEQVISVTEWNNVSTTTWSMNPGTYDFSAQMDGHYQFNKKEDVLTIFDTDTHYVKEHIRLSERCHEFINETCYKSGTSVFDFSKDYTEDGTTYFGNLIFVSGSFIQGVVPDEDGYVDVYVCTEDPYNSYFTCAYGYKTQGAQMHGCESGIFFNPWEQNEIKIKTIKVPENGVTLAGLTEGTTYEIRQTSEGGSKATSKKISFKVYKNPSSVPTVTVELAPKAPVISSVTNKAGSVQVTWGKVTGVDGYYVYRKDTQAGSWHFIGGTKTLSFTDTNVENGTVYYYAIKSFVKDASANAISASGPAKNTIYVKNIFVSSLTNKNAGAMVVGHSTNALASGYEVMVSNSDNMSNAITMRITNPNYYTATFTGLTKNKTCYVQVRAYKTVAGYTFYSAWSAIKSIQITK